MADLLKQLAEAVETWRQRDLSVEPIKYMYVDGTLFSMRIDGSVEKVPVLVAIGVTEGGHRTVLGLQSGDKESATSWREMFKGLKSRGLDAARIRLGIMDGLPGLERVFKEEFTKAKVQRCQVHVARNILAKVPQKLKKDVADQVRSIFYASTKAKAIDFFESFRERKRIAFGSQVLGKLFGIMPDVFTVSPGRMGLSANHQRYRASQQGI